MRWLLLALLGSTGVIITGLCLLYLMLRGRFRRAHRVDPRTPTEAPGRWMVDPRAPARLHVRLTRVGRTARTVLEDHRPATRRARKAQKADPGHVVQLAERVVAEAVALDQQVARLAALSGPARKTQLVVLSRQVTDLENTAAQLVAVSVEAQAPTLLTGSLDGLGDVRAQVANLAEAQAALRDLDADAGLARPEPGSAPPPGPARRTEPPHGHRTAG